MFFRASLLLGRSAALPYCCMCFSMHVPARPAGFGQVGPAPAGSGAPASRQKAAISSTAKHVFICLDRRGCRCCCAQTAAPTVTLQMEIELGGDDASPCHHCGSCYHFGGRRLSSAQQRTGTGLPPLRGCQDCPAQLSCARAAEGAAVMPCAGEHGRLAGGA
jgi:hypothetical protein